MTLLSHPSNIFRPFGLSEPSDRSNRSWLRCCHSGAEAIFCKSPRTRASPSSASQGFGPSAQQPNSLPNQCKQVSALKDISNNLRYSAKVIWAMCLGVRCHIGRDKLKKQTGVTGFPLKLIHSLQVCLETIVTCGGSKKENGGNPGQLPIQIVVVPCPP